jgi:hypothetical protein
LLATNIPGAIPVNDKPGATPAADPVFGGTPAPFSIADHFIGGAGDRTYKKTANGTDEYFTVAVAADGMVTLTVRDASDDPTNTDGADLATFTVVATDANNIIADKQFTVERNIAPTVVRAVYPTLEDNGVIGTQDVVNPLDSEESSNADDIALRPNLNEYVITLVENTDFGDAEFDLLKFTAESSDPTKASVAVDGTKIIITGVAATAADTPVMVKIKAVDAGGLESGEVTVTATVVAPPTEAKDTTLANHSVPQNVDVMVAGVAGFFTPAGLTYSATSSRPTVATVSDQNITPDLEVETVNVGETTITLKATDSIGQYVARDFTVTVTTPTS